MATRDERDARAADAALFAAVTAAMQAPFLLGSLADEIDLGGGQAVNRMLVSAFFVATAAGALLRQSQAAIPAMTLIGLAPLLAAGSLAILAIAPGPLVAIAVLTAAGLLNGAVTRAAIRVVNGLPPEKVPGGLAQLTVATVSAPLFVGLAVGLAGATGAGPRTTVAAHAALVACAATVTVPATRRHAPGVGAAREEPQAAPVVDRAPDGWRLITLCAFAAAMSSYIVAIFFVPLVREAGVGVTAAGLALLWTSVVAAATRLWISRHPEVIGPRSRHTSTLILVGAGGTGLLAVGPPALLVVSMPLIGVGAWGWIGLLLSASRHARDPVRTGAAIQGSNYAAAAAAPLLAGAGVALIGSSTLLLMLTASAALSAVVLWRPLARLDAGAG